jgi:hypothetical protein
VAGGASQLMALVHFSSLVRFRRGPPRRVDGQPPAPCLATTPAWTQAAASLGAYGGFGAQAAGGGAPGGGGPPSSVSVPGALGRKTLTPLELVLSSGALPADAVARVRAAAARAAESPESKAASSEASSSSSSSSAMSLETALSAALAGVPARALHAAVASRGEACAPLRPQADDLVSAGGAALACLFSPCAP